MAFNPNEEQLEFLQSKKCNVLVSASAGSGKTSTMIQKLMQILIDDKVSIQKLLVLTFTDAAASEIKQKLFSAITEKIESTDAENRAFLKSQLDSINSAEIGTLHSVCKKLIIKYFYEINESPDFGMLTDRESKYLIDIAMSSIFEKYIKAHDQGFFDLYDCYNSKRNDLNLKKIILSLLDYLRNKSNYKQWIENTINSSFNSNLNENGCCKFLHDYTVNNLKEFIDPINSLIELSKANGYVKYTNFLYEKKQCLDEIISSHNFIQMQKIIFNLPTIIKPRKSSKSDTLELEFDEQVDNLNQRINETIKIIKSYIITDNEEETKNHILKSKENVTKIVAIIEDVLNEYTRLKKNRNCLDFNDLEDKMLELLEYDKVVKILKSNYQFVFFDEYQDINEKQELILSKLVSRDNYYMIGDVKQSIYAFRQSSPKIFVSKFYKFNQDGVKNKVINFNKNYRSDKNILEFDNLVFDKLITDKTIGINYKDNSRFQSERNFVDCNVEMKIINSKQEESEDESKEEIDAEEKEALLVADSIANLLSMKKENGEYYSYKDIAIILRKRGSFLKVLCDTLTTMQIPINATISSEFFETYEINLMMAISQIGANFKNDIALSIVLKNLFDVSDEELFTIRKSSTDKNFFDCVKNYDVNDTIANKLSKFNNFILEIRQFISYHTTYEYLQMVIQKFDILTRLKSMNGGVEKVQNVNEFLKLSDNENYKYNLHKFVEYLDFASSDTQLQSIGSTGNSVQIMTIHYSKGLEFPAVIFAGLGKKFTINKDTNDIIINENMGFGLKSINPVDRTLSETIIRNACKIDNKKSELNEEIRLLYVAMTRPKEKLILIGRYNLDDYEKTKVKDIYNSKNYLDLIFKSIPDEYNSNFINNKKFVMYDNTDACCNVNFYKLEDIVTKSERDESNIMIGKCDTNLLEAFGKIVNKKVNTNTFTIKNTVTNILNEEKDYENINYYPNKLDSSDKLENTDALKLGTAYHSVMQNLKFTENKAEIKELIDNLVIKNIITREYADKISIEEIYKAKEVLQDYILNADQVYREKQFVMQENYNKIVKNSDNNTKVIIQGIIDLVVIKDDISYLIDYKTNRTNNEEFLKSNYALQLQIYSDAFYNATNVAIKKKFLYSFCLGKLIEVN